MAFTQHQQKFLSAKLKRKFVKTRTLRDTKLSYVEGWHVISEANRIFGFDRWDRTTLSPKCIWADQVDGATLILYATKVCITVRAGGTCVTREGIGTGFGRSYSPEAAHEVALKAAETDATKRALATFGNPFGLALYDKDQAGVTRARTNKPSSQTVESAATSRTPVVIYARDGAQLSAANDKEIEELVAAYIQSINELDGLYAFWEDNRGVFKELRERGPAGAQVVERLVAGLRTKARSFSPVDRPPVTGDTRQLPAPALAIPKERRVRDKEHLKFVRQQPCLICGRQPSHAHHIRFAQPAALGLKVSDEFTVPLCSLHHDAVHRVGNERSWWTAQAIDPLKAAAELWKKSS